MDNFVELFMVSPLLLVVLFFVAMLAGFIDALAGGGGLLTVPALLAAGMSPAQALATNKLQACGGSLSASLYFIRRKVVSLADQKLNILMTFIARPRVHCWFSMYSPIFCARSSPFWLSASVSTFC